ncbi:Gfo/Idh/MocA family oxidoreductase [Parapedobacter sp. ISTM3]|uniref:Gfo/Idh/MocA family protein n=1 Tax=Parapedobacter sp. ISTM3 TaxID=2800130 RepID=UPI00190421F3|nr:Gfo/Idh/MocA family oxidoreductase [Parapedobacter sp. ISTM3]MBK1438446.1 Gfo/Idh/MocA family oxidoreductase [Parapedobacter sp. ISTM3]
MSIHHSIPREKLGVALVGLGEYSSGQLGPALKATAYCSLTAVVSGSEEKRKKWQDEYQLKSENLYSYADFDRIKDNTDIDIVYIVLPNSMHAEYTIRAARAGKHVICEKPLATTVEDGKRMIEACNEAGVRLSVGYRLHFDLFHQELMRLGRGRTLGKVRRIIADDSMAIGEKDQWRVKGSLAGGGPLMNNGIYCVQAAQYITGQLPVAVNASFLPKTDPEKFKDVEEGIQWEMEFVDGTVAICESSYARDGNFLRAEADDGWFELSPAYEYSGLKGRASTGEMIFPEVNQQALQMDDFAICIKNNKTSRVSGEMGLRDLIILKAIYKSASGGRKEPLDLDAFAQP